MNPLFQDLKYGLRILAKNPGFTAVAVLTLALGIGASTAVFSVVNTVLLKPLPYADPDRLVTVESLDNRRASVRNSLSYPDFFDFRAQNHVFDHLVTSRDTNLVLTGLGQPQQLDGEMVTWDLFPALGIVPQLGRGFLASEEAAGTHVVVLSHGLWQRQFGGDPAIIGRSITLDRKPYAVVGVAAAGFAFPPNAPNIQLWTTIAADREAPTGGQPMTEQRGAHMLTALARLKPGVSAERARADLDVIAAALAKQYPDTNTNFRRASVIPALETLVGDSRTPLLMLLGAVGLLLLIACANVANLLLVRTTTREHEMAVRAALGASGVRVVRQLLTESLLLAILGGTAGVALGEYALRFILPLGGESIPRLAQASIDGRVLAFSVALAVITSLLFGMAPALRASKIDLTGSLKEQARGGTDRHDRVRGALVVAQVTLGLVLVSGAGLLMASFLHLEASDLGLRPDHLLTYWFNLPDPQYNTAQQVAFYDQLLERMRAVPGVQSAAGVWPLPLGGDDATISFDIEERPVPQPSRPAARMAFTTPGYFSTSGIPLLKGRFFDEHDDKTSLRVLIVNKAFADKFFPGEDVIGKRITPGAIDSGEKAMPHEIVGVVGSAKLFALDTEPQPIYYFPYKQLAWMPPVVMLRTAVPPRTLESAIRGQMAALDPLIPVFQVRTMEELLSTQVVEPRFHTLLLGCFAGIALLLTMVGLYGVVAYSVTRRTREIGLRMALGAGRSTVLFMVLRQALVLVVIGLALGLAGALAGGQLLSGMLFGIKPLNPLVLASACCLIGLTGALAAYLPARRATKVDPMEALRHE
ncbi:MAG: ABC transporter permease [Terriglobia bacterium]